MPLCNCYNKKYDKNQRVSHIFRHPLPATSRQCASRLHCKEPRVQCRCAVAGVTGWNGWSSQPLAKNNPYNTRLILTWINNMPSAGQMCYICGLVRVGIWHLPTDTMILSWRKAGVTVSQPTSTMLYVKPQLLRLCPIRMWWYPWRIWHIALKWAECAPCRSSHRIS